jgi:cell division septation protein DedD
VSPRQACSLLAALLAAISSGSARADFDAGLEAHAQGDYAQAHAEWLPLAEAGDTAAQANLGVMYLKGQGVDVDPAEAARWFLRAAEQGNPVAQDNLGQLYYLGEGVPKDVDAAAHWIKAAAFAGDPSAQLRLGTLYAHGIGVERDPARALLWWRKSAAQGHAAAQARIAAAGGVGHVSEEFTPDASPPDPSGPAPPVPDVASPPPVAAAPVASPIPAPPRPRPASRQPEDAAPAVAAATSGGFVVQIASVREEEDVEPEWARLQRRNWDLLGDLELDVQKQALGTRVVYRIRVGPPRDRAAAETLCAALEERRVGCLLREAP